MYLTAYLLLLARRQVVLGDVEQIIIQIEIVEDHLGMEDVFLVDVDIDHIVTVARRRGDVILDGIDAVIDEQLLAVHIARKAADAVIEGDDVRIETVQEVIQGIERRNAAARRDIDIGPGKS